MFQLYSDQRKSNRIDPLADPGFPRREAPTPEFGSKTHYLRRFLPKTAWKLKKKGIRQWDHPQCPKQFQAAYFFKQIQVVQGRAGV